MKRLFVLLCAFTLLALAGNLAAASWSYNFGTGSDSYTTSNSSSTTFLPNQPTGGGTHRVRVSNGGGGGFYRDDPGLTDFGAGSELRISASSTTGNGNINKYSVYDWPSGSNLARRSYIRTQLRLGSSTGGSASSGTFYFFVGDDITGTSYAGDNPFTANDNVIGFQWVFGANGTITTSYRLNNAWATTGVATFTQGTTYTLEFYINNGSGSSITEYTRSGTTYTCANRTWDLWMNGTRVMAGIGLGWTRNPNTKYDSMMYYGEGSTSNAANLFLDTSEYTNNWDPSYGPTYTEFYSKSTGNLDVTTNWGIYTDGTGVNPTNFTTAGQTFHIRNNSAPTIGANWTVSGTGTQVYLGDGTNTCTFTIPSAYSMTGSINVNNNGILNIQNTTNPTLGTLATGSTVRYSGSSNLTVVGTTYYNLSIQGTGTKTLGGTTSATNRVYVGDGTNTVTLTVPSTYALTGTVDVNAYGILDLEHYSLPTLGTLATNSTVRYNYAGDQQVTGATYYTLQVDNGYTKTMQNDVTVTNLNFANAGTLALNSYDLTLAGKDISFYSTNAVFSALTVANSFFNVNGVGLGPIWDTTGSFTNSVDVTFRYSTALSTDTTISLWYYDDAAVWTYYGDLTATDGLDGYMYATVTGLTSLGSGAKGPIKWTFTPIDETLPVELSSFTAAMSAQNYVMLQWVTQSETNVVGYRIFRNTVDDLSGAEMLNAFIEATNTSTMQVYVYWDEEVYTDGTYYYWLQNLDFSGESAFHGPVSITVSLDDHGTPAIPVVQGINNAYPNPFNPSTTIEFGVLRPGNVNISVYNSRGQLVRNLFNGLRETGTYFLTWDGTDSHNRALASGIYYIRMDVNGSSTFRKVMLMK